MVDGGGVDGLVVITTAHKIRHVKSTAKAVLVLANVDRRGFIYN